VNYVSLQQNPLEKRPKRIPHGSDDLASRCAFIQQSHPHKAI